MLELILQALLIPAFVQSALILGPCTVKRMRHYWGPLFENILCVLNVPRYDVLHVLYH